MTIFSNDLNSIEHDIVTLNSISSGIEKYGINQTSLHILHKHHLLKDTSLTSLGLESITSETQGVALEAIGAEVKEKTAQWSAKIIGFFNDGTKLILDKIQNMWEAVKAKAEPLTTKAWDTTKVAGEKISAHPYKTILIALGAAAAVFGVIAFVGTSLPVGVVTNGQLHSFMLRLQTMYHRINLPFGKITTTAVSDGRLIFATVDNSNMLPSTVVKTAAGLGWTQSAAKAIFTQGSKVIDGAKKGVEVIWNRVLKPGEKIVAKVIFAPKDLKDFINEKTGMRTAGWISDQVVPALYYSLLYKLIRNLYDIVKDVVFKTIKMIKDTFSSLTKVLA